MRVLKQKEYVIFIHNWEVAEQALRTSLSISTERQYGAITRASTMDLNETSQKIVYTSPPLFMVSLSTILVPQSQLQSENIKWKNQETIHKFYISCSSE